MKKKALACGIIATTLALGIGLSGCSLVSTNSEKNIDLVIANVDITEAEKFDEDNEFYEYKDAITEEATEIYKRDLIAYFLNAGYSYVQSGMTYRQTFNTLVDSLTQTEILYQYATFYLLDYIVENKEEVSDADAAIEAYSAYEPKVKYMDNYSDDSVKSMYVLDNVREILNEKYVQNKDENSSISMTEDDIPDRVLLATYDLFSSLNASLDSYESALFDDDDDRTGSGSRSTPENVDTEKEDFYPTKEDDDGNVVLDYGIYTGYGTYTMANSGTYRDDRLDNSTRTTRRSAYNSFIETLKANYLLGEDENYDDILALQYMQGEMTNQLKEQVIEQFYAVYELEQQEVISDEEYLTTAYDEMLKIQETTLSDTASFGSALGSMSDDSFVLYAPSTTKEGGGKYGFVYNILLPFSSSQSVVLGQYSESLSDDVISYNQYYTWRNDLLKGITTTDQRDAWFNGSTDYSFDASRYYGEDEYYVSSLNSGADTDYLFFENNLTKTERYETLDKYYGRYAYNGRVYTADDDMYILFPNELSIDEMLDEFVGYVDFALGNDAGTTEYTTVEEYYDYEDYASEKFLAEHEDYDPMDLTADDIDYTKFIYAYGSVAFENETEFSMFDLVNPDTQYYTAMSAVNELQYAYTTDTSVLSEYVGYTVNAGSTSYIKEFEKAAQVAISGGKFGGNGEEYTVDGGVGTFIVCAGDYGWHLIYVTAVFENECEEGDGYAIYGEEIDWDEKFTEGTFANLFYEFIKEIELESVSDNLRTELLADFCDDDSVVLIEENYNDLLSMG